MEKSYVGPFRGEYYFLSNMFECPVEYDGLRYRSSEAAFQAQRCFDKNERVKFTSMTGFEAKAYAKELWKQGLALSDRGSDQILRIMYDVCLAKFTQNPELKTRLLSTGTTPLIEENWWHDNFWGACNCNKCRLKDRKNYMGKILMRIRRELAAKA